MCSSAASDNVRGSMRVGREGNAPGFELSRGHMYQSSLHLEAFIQTCPETCIQRCVHQACVLTLTLMLCVPLLCFALVTQAGDTPLMLACMHKQPKVVRALVGKGANLKAINKVRINNGMSLAATEINQWLLQPTGLGSFGVAAPELC